MSFSLSEYTNTPKSTSAGALPQTPLGELTALPQTPYSWFQRDHFASLRQEGIEGLGGKD